MAAIKNRKDSKGYVLRNGETERKDGRYCYAYTDSNKQRHFIYAKTLARLREREKELLVKYEQGLDPYSAKKLTLNDCFDRYMSQKYNLKESTKANYLYMYNRFVRPTFGKRKIDGIRYSDVKAFYFSILKEGVKANTLEGIHTVIHPALQLAVRDRLIVNNPSDCAMTEIKRSKLWDAPKRKSLTIPQQKALMNYLEEDNQFAGWIPIITVLLGTGMRIGECLALRWEDLDFEKRMISVNHTLSDRPDSKGVCKKRIETPKTDAGIRTIPMIQEVFDAFLTEYEIQKCIGFCEEVIDGYSGFVFSTAYHTVYSATAVNNAIHRVTAVYNNKEEKEAKKEKREPILLPHFSAHTLRHTFCSRLCENETNLKVIMDIMGHADISTTMDIYAECTGEKKQQVMTNLDGCIIIK